MWLIINGRVEGGRSVSLRKAISSHLVALSEKKLIKAFYGPRTYDHGTRFLVCVDTAGVPWQPALQSMKEALDGFTVLEKPVCYFARAAVEHSLW